MTGLGCGWGPPHLMVVDTGETSARDGDRSALVVTGLGKAGFQSCGTDWPTAEFGTDLGTVGTLGTDEARVWVAMRSLLVGESGPLSISGLSSAEGQSRIVDLGKTFFFFVDGRNCFWRQKGARNRKGRNSGYRRGVGNSSAEQVPGM